MLVADWGLTAYREAWQRQLELWQPMVEAKREHRPVGEEYIILTEHRPVYTLGRHGHPENMLISAERLQALGAELVPIERGGDITFHGPGQLVAYPIIDLEAHHLGLKAYIHILEEAVIRTIAHWDIRGARDQGATGVWLEPCTPRTRKICAIGVRCSRFVAMHGLALNVATDLDFFHAINPCGFTNRGVTSILRERPDLDPASVMTQAKTLLAEHLRELL